MVRLVHDMMRLVLVVMLPQLLVMDSAMAQNVVYKGGISTLSVAQYQGHTYEWELYDDASVDFAVVPGNCPGSRATFTTGKYGSSVNVQWLELGTYFFKVTARDALGCAMNLKVGIIEVVTPTLQAIISGATIAGACQYVMLDASKSLGAIQKYEWQLLDQGGTLSSQTGLNTDFLLSPDFMSPLPADFRVRLLVTDQEGSTNSDTLTINVDNFPVADVFSSGKLEKDGSMVVDGSVSTGSALSYRWFTSDGSIIGPADLPTANLSGAGTYSLEITDNHGCVSVKSFKFPLEAAPQIIANPDFATASWSKNSIISVMDNDSSSGELLENTVKIIEQPVRGTVTINPDGTITYVPNEQHSGRDRFIYEVCDEDNDCASATVSIVIHDLGITAPEGFSPNGDGLNEHLVFKGLENYPKSQLYVYTRSGQLVYQSENYQNNWDGTTNTSKTAYHELVPTGTYYYVLKLGGADRSLKGFVYIGY